MELNQFLGKNNEDLEKAFGFTWYIELKDKLVTGKDQKHSDIIEAFCSFVEGSLTVVKTDDGVIEEFFEMDNTTIKNNLLLLEKEQGIFYDEDICISYAFLGRNLFAYVLPNMLMFSSAKEDIPRMAKILDGYSLEYFEPYELGREKQEMITRKLGRNEPCHCNSGKKYKKCCLDKDIKESGKPKKLPCFRGADEKTL